MIKIQITLFGGCYYIWCIYRKVRWQPLNHKICPAKSNPAAPVGESRILQSLCDTPQKSSFRTAGHKSSKKVAYVLQTFNSISIFALATIDTPLQWCQCFHFLMPPFLQIQVERYILASRCRYVKVSCDFGHNNTFGGLNVPGYACH